MKLHYILTITDEVFDPLLPDDVQISVIGSVGDGIGIDVRTPGNIAPDAPELGEAKPLQRDRDLANHVAGRLMQEAPTLMQAGAVYYIRLTVAEVQSEVQQVVGDNDIIDAEIVPVFDAEPEHNNDHDAGIDAANISIH